jgi:hypothetical protein
MKYFLQNVKGFTFVNILTSLGFAALIGSLLAPTLVSVSPNENVATNVPTSGLGIVIAEPEQLPVEDILVIITNSATGQKISRTVSPSTTSTTFAGLDPQAEYEVEVAKRSQAGLSSKAKVRVQYMQHPSLTRSVERTRQVVISPQQTVVKTPEVEVVTRDYETVTEYSNVEPTASSTLSYTIRAHPEPSEWSQTTTRTSVTGTICPSSTSTRLIVNCEAPILVPSALFGTTWRTYYSYRNKVTIPNLPIIIGTPQTKTETINGGTSAPACPATNAARIVENCTVVRGAQTASRNYDWIFTFTETTTTPGQYVITRVIPGSSELAHGSLNPNDYTCAPGDTRIVSTQTTTYNLGSYWQRSLNMGGFTIGGGVFMVNAGNQSLTKPLITCITPEESEVETYTEQEPISMGMATEKMVTAPEGQLIIEPSSLSTRSIAWNTGTVVVVGEGVSGYTVNDTVVFRNGTMFDFDGKKYLRVSAHPSLVKKQ